MLALVNTLLAVPKGCTSRTFNGTRPADRKRLEYIITRQPHRKLVRNVAVHTQPAYGFRSQHRVRPSPTPRQIRSESKTANVGNRSASGVGDAVCRQSGSGVDIAAWTCQDDACYSCRARQKFGLSVSDERPRPCTCGPIPAQRRTTLQIEATGQRYKQTTEFVYLGGAISESADLDTQD